MRNHTLTKAEQLLAKEYELRAGQMLHEDKLRHQLIRFVITLSTAVIGGLFYLDQFYCDSQLNLIIIISISSLIIVIGVSIIIIAKIRRSQILSMAICEKIRNHFYKENYLYYSNINIVGKEDFPNEIHYFNKPSQTRWFVYLLSFFNSCLIMYLINIIYSIDNIIKIIINNISWDNVFYIFLPFIFIFHIHVFKWFCKPDRTKEVRPWK